MRRYEARVYSGDTFVKFIETQSISTLKRLASIKCNNHYNTIDSMIVEVYEGKMQSANIRLNRINRKYPNNIIERGQWA